MSQFFQLFKKKGAKAAKKKSNEITIKEKLPETNVNPAIAHQLNEVDELMVKLTTALNAETTEIWREIFVRLEKTNEGKSVFKKFNYSGLRNEIESAQFPLPKSSQAVRRFVMDEDMKLRPYYKQIYSTKFHKIADIAESVYKRHDKRLEDITDLMAVLELHEKQLLDLQNQDKAKSNRLESRRLQRVASKLMDLQSELTELENDVDALRVKSTAPQLSHVKVTKT